MQKNQGNRNPKGNRGGRSNGQAGQPQSPPKVTVGSPKKDALEIIRPQGNPQPPPPHPQNQAAQQPQHHESQPAQPALQVSLPKREPVSVQVSPEAAQQMALRKQTHTYTIEQLKAKRHDRELTAPSVFQFYAELQLFKRFMSNTHKSRGHLKPTDMPVLQHKINSILLHFNVNTFPTVFNEILALGIDNEVFVLSYVNVVFKQAVLNPPLALLFSMLSVNVSYVMKHTKFADRMKELFMERCTESFVVPKEDTDKGTLILLRGIVTFAGHLLRDSMLQSQLLSDWATHLIKSGNKNSLMMLIDLLVAGGAALTTPNQAILDQLKTKMSSVTDTELLERYTNLTDIIQSAVPPAEQTDRELRNPEMKHSPSVDKDLDGKYPTLFKRSDSIPLELSALADEDNDENDIASVVTNYLYNSDLAEAAAKLEALKYQKNELKTAVDLLRAVVQQPADRQLVISELVISMLYQGFYDDDLLRQAVTAVAKENPSDIEHGRKLALIFAQLLSKEVVTFDDFEGLFADMRGIWKYIIPTFFQENDRLLGTWIDEMMDCDFWRHVRFVDATTPDERLTAVHEMDIADFFPHLDLAYAFREKSKGGADGTDVVLACNTVDKEYLAPAIFDVLLSFQDAQMEAAAGKLKQYFAPVKKVFAELGEKGGERGKKLAGLLQ
ncbi:hypothetical protein TRFO_29934 [Tritrichomonas foetus]|uniref:Uncharacterized protein n=1 Tax=Tritrichomonas foetus TaxID=1144522 RepID=A0A1J4JZ89_9EUKA|nr:hypothetical protein TRFO_29934 [Tritrichomonas foetus]|eukprot:OHT02806.1 hypothetical protein TRFO_29934 [Tritrichomonas foetus]